MARTKQTPRPSTGDIRTTWTRFRLPVKKDLSTLPESDDNVHLDPLAGVIPSYTQAWLGRMVEDPEQAAIIIKWRTMQDLEQFQSSPACAAFLQSLSPDEGDDRQTFNPKSRFTVFRDAEATFTPPVEGRVTLTALMVSLQDESMKAPLYQAVKSVFDSFVPRGCEKITNRWPPLRPRHLASWHWAIGESAWATKLFSDAKYADEESHRRALLCEFRRWNGHNDATPELEEWSAKDPQARESWAQAVARVTPPVVGWVQERWDLRQLSLWSPEDQAEVEPEESEYEEQLAAFCSSPAVP